MSELNKEIEAVDGSAAAVQARARVERKRATVIAVVVFFLFVIVGSLYAMPSKGARRKSELIFTTALVVAVGIAVAVSVKLSLNKKANPRS
jgi:hypothetical protein